MEKIFEYLVVADIFVMFFSVYSLVLSNERAAMVFAVLFLGMSVITAGVFIGFGLASINLVDDEDEEESEDE
jgi:hypothetical protein